MNTCFISAKRHWNTGFTLVEMMIAMLLSVILLGGVIQISSSTKATYRTNEAVAQLQENGRFSVEILARDIRMADFWGCANNVTLVKNNLKNGGTGYIDFANGGVGGVEGGSSPDTLILRGGFNSGVPVVPPFSPQASAAIHVSNSNGLNQDDIVIVSDCSSADVFQLNNDPGSSGTLVHNTAPGNPGNENSASIGSCPGANAHCLSKIYAGDATVYPVQQLTYSIGAGTSGQPALLRNGQELVDGIEDLQVLYGEDIDPPETAGSGSANRYVPADQVSNMNKVVSIRFALVVRSYEDNVTTGQTYDVLGTSKTSADNRLRQVYTSTVSIRNRLK